MKIDLPFKDEFHKPMLSGAKTWTSRTRKYGEKDDTFIAFGQEFVLSEVFKMRLDVVAWLHCNEEGFSEPEDFIECWKRIHPIKGYIPEQTVWVHQFKKMEASQQ